MARYARSERFFLIISAVLVASILLGFGSAILSKPGGPSAPEPIVIVHGLATLGWFLLAIAQALLIRNARFALHKQLGWIGCAYAALVVVLGYFTTRNAFGRDGWSVGGFDEVGSAVFPFFDITTFALFVTLGVLQRKKREAHKRLMALAGVMMMDPTIARVGIHLLGNPMLAIPFELAILLAFPIYDWRTRGRPHWASVLGVTLFLGCFALRLGWGGTESWAAFATALYG